MFRKLLGLAGKISSSSQAGDSRVERSLARITTEIPEIHWAALVTSHGLLRGSFPPQPGLGGDRLSAMSAAMLSLGERIANELKDGELRYTLIAGSEGATLLLVLSRDDVLTLGLSPDASFQAVVNKVQGLLPALLNVLEGKMW